MVFYSVFEGKNGYPPRNIFSHAWGWRKGWVSVLTGGLQKMAARPHFLTFLIKKWQPFTHCHPIGVLFNQSFK
jgi:hypothetical protein